TWQTDVPGVRTVAGHRVEATGSKSTRVTLSLSWRGPLAPLIGLLYRKRSRRYVEMEAQGLKQRCEVCEGFLPHSLPMRCKASPELAAHRLVRGLGGCATTQTEGTGPARTFPAILPGSPWVVVTVPALVLCARL